jgi:stage V sporulation protein B
LVQDKELAKNTALLTASGLVMRFVGMIWQVWLVGRIGQAGIGLFQLVVSVGSLAATVAVSGIRYTTTRLVSEELGLSQPGGAAQALGSCTLYGLFFGLAAGLGLLFLAEPLGFLWLEDARTVQPLMVLALEMPLTGLDSVIHGYFTAVGRVWKSVVVSICQQLITIAATAVLLAQCPADNLSAACLAITAGQLLGAILEMLALVVIYLQDRRRHNILRHSPSAPSHTMTDRMLTIALPLAMAAYGRSGLSTLQHLLVPWGLRASGMESESALAGYGIIQGMALPVVLFPSCVMVAVAELIVPKLTAHQVQGQKGPIQAVTERILDNGLAFSLLIAALMAALGDGLGLALYDSAQAGTYIQLFALIIPVMYLDMLADGCLKGLGQMMFCMYVNIADAGLSALLVWLLLPRWGLSAYILTICFTEIFNFALSLWRLKKVAGLTLCPRRFFRLTGEALAAGCLAWLTNHAISAGNGVPALIISAILALGFYSLLHYAWGGSRQTSI